MREGTVLSAFGLPRFGIILSPEVGCFTLIRELIKKEVKRVDPEEGQYGYSTKTFILVNRLDR